MKERIKNKALRRLKILEGQIRGLQNMVEKEIYCIDVITQSQAIKQALSSVEDLLLQNHLETHVIEQMKSGQEQRAVNEIVEVFKLAKKK